MLNEIYLIKTIVIFFCHIVHFKHFLLLLFVTFRNVTSNPEKKRGKMNTASISDRGWGDTTLISARVRSSLKWSNRIAYTNCMIFSSSHMIIAYTWWVSNLISNTVLLIVINIKDTGPISYKTYLHLCLVFYSELCLYAICKI